MRLLFPEILDGEVEADLASDDCGNCGEETPHYNHLYMVEGRSDEKAPLSKGPYRAFACLECEEKSYDRGIHL